MKLKKLFSLFAIIAAVVMLPAAGLAYIEAGQNNRATVPSGQTIDDDLYIASETVVVEGTVNGDVYAAGSSVSIRGTVNGDVFAAGSDVIVGGTVKGSVRAAGSSVRLDGATIGGSVSGFASTFTVEKDTKIGGGINFGSSATVIRGDVARGIVGGASSVVIASNIGKNADLAASRITLESSAKINGNLTYYGDATLQRDSGSQVTGEVKHLSQNQKKQEQQAYQDKAAGAIWWLLALYLTGALMIWLFPTMTSGVSSTIGRRPGLSAATGSLVLLLSFPLFIVLLITLIGIPIALIFAGVLAVAIYLSKFFTALTVGNLIARRTGWKPNPYADAAIGLILITLLELIPFIGWLAALLSLLFGLGALVIWFYNRSRGQSTPVQEAPSKPAKPAKA